MLFNSSVVSLLVYRLPTLFDSICAKDETTQEGLLKDADISENLDTLVGRELKYFVITNILSLNFQVVSGRSGI